jgi:serine/threonine protein kinase
MTRPELPAPTLSATALETRLRDAIAPKYYLVRRLGAGGMGSVYLALEPALRRTVAVKVLAPELSADREARLRFEREVHAVAALVHPNVIAIHGMGELDDGTPWFVMQYVNGRSMAARVATDGPLPVAEARRVIGGVASALAAAHAKGIIHRDIKPENILYDDELGRALISDFGIAAVRSPLGGMPDVKLTAAGAAIGTPEYMSPEAMLAEPVTDRTDVYALGLMAFELLAGRPAFSAKTQHALIMAHLSEIPARLSTVRSDVDAQLDDLVAACLSKDAAARPSALEVAAVCAPSDG